jgi:hypothetical protein
VVDQPRIRERPHRLEVPHRVDGPKVILGVSWAVSLLLAVVVAAPLAVVVLAPVAAAAGLQVGHAWSHREPSDRWACSLGAGAVVVAALAGVAALGAGLVAVTVGLLAYAMVLPVSSGTDRMRFSEVLMLSALPVGLSAGSLLALATDHSQAFVGLVALISIYEMGDFLVGSGSANAFEGPLAGLTGLVLVAAGLYVMLPDPFTTADLPVFAAVAMLGAPLGQVAGSALLPTGAEWAPALRRLDSYLLAAPVWLVLLAG